jgi:hypothetical protein
MNTRPVAGGKKGEKIWAYLIYSRRERTEQLRKIPNGILVQN